MAEAEKELVISPQRKILRFCLVSLIVVVCVYVTLYGTAMTVTLIKEAKIKKEWEKYVPEYSNLSFQPQYNGSNKTAKLIFEWGQKNKMYFYSNDITDESWSLVDELNNPTDRMKPLSPSVKAYLDSQQPFLKNLGVVVRLESPQWSNNKSARFSEQVDDFGITCISVLLAIDILSKTDDGKTKEALESMETGWQIIEACRLQADFSSQQVAMSNQKLLVRVLAKMKDVPPDWQNRIVKYSYQKTFEKNLAIWSKMLLEKVAQKEDVFSRYPHQDPLIDQPPTIEGRLFTLLARPYFRVCAANIVEANLKGLETYSVAKAQCRFDFELVRNEVRNHLAGWNYQKDGFSIGRLDGVCGLLDFEILTELTQFTLQLKEVQQRTPNQKLVPSHPKVESKVCPGEYWEYQPQPDGTFVLKFSGKKMPKIPSWRGLIVRT